MVNAILDYILLLDRLVIKWLILLSGFENGLIFAILPIVCTIITSCFVNVQKEVLINYNRNQVMDKLESEFKEASSKESLNYHDLEEMKNIQKSIYNMAKIMNDAGYSYEEIIGRNNRR